MSETIRCPFCIDGEWYRDTEFKEPYGYPYRPQTIPCGVCHGSKAILKSEVQNHPDKEQITESEREIFIEKQKSTLPNSKSVVGKT